MFLGNRSENMMPRSKREKIDFSSALMIAPFLILFAVFTLLPVLVSIFLSLFTYDMVTMPKFAGFSNYARMFLGDNVFLISVKNTLMFAVVTGPVSIYIGVDDKRIHPKNTQFTFVFILFTFPYGWRIFHLAGAVQW